MSKIQFGGYDTGRAKFYATAVKTPELVLNSDTFTQSLQSEVFKLIVGNEKKEYFVHKQALFRSSPYFTTLFTTSIPTQEMLDKSVTLDSAVDSNEAWKHVISFMYLADYNIGETQNTFLESSLTHAHVYVLAEKLCMEELKSLANKKLSCALSQFSDRCISLERILIVTQLVNIVYGNTPSNSSHRSLPTSTTSIFDPSVNRQEERTKSHIESQTDIRSVISSFVALHIENMRQHESFHTTMQEFPEFTIDLVMKMNNRIY